MGAERQAGAEWKGSIASTDDDVAMPVSCEFCCPRCGCNACREQRLPHPGLLFWLVFPALVVNEVLLGQRIPRVTYICIGCDQPLGLRQYVRCSACGKYHSAMLWGRSNVLGHWFGLFCPDCGGRIPVLLGACSLIVVMVLAPLWWPLWRLIRPRWIALEQRRARRIAARGHTDRIPIKNWTLWGMFAFGLPTGLIMSIGGDWATNRPQPWFLTVLQVLVCTAGGAVFGWVMKATVTRSHRFQLGHCRNCGYELQGLPRQVCPECGYHFSPDDLTS